MLNLKTPEEQEILHKLIVGADIFICNNPRRASRQNLGIDKKR